MANNLIFPIGFDLEEAVKKAGQEWNKTYSQITSTLVLLSIVMEALVLCELRKRQVIASLSLLNWGSPISPYMQNSLCTIAYMLSPIISKFPFLIIETDCALFASSKRHSIISQSAPTQFNGFKLIPTKVFSDSFSSTLISRVKSRLRTSVLLCPREIIHAVSHGRPLATSELVLSDFLSQPISSSERNREKSRCFISKTF